MRGYLKKSVSALSVAAAISLAGGTAYAQELTSNQAPANGADKSAEQEVADTDEQAPEGDQIIVTGSRIASSGFTAPTPVTVVTTEELQRTVPGAIPEGLNQLPQFAGSRSNTTPGGLGNTPSTGNYLNLRNLGSLRNLILLDGQRLPPTSYEGITDANIIPQALVQRV